MKKLVSLLKNMKFHYYGNMRYVPCKIMPHDTNGILHYSVGLHTHTYIYIYIHLLK